MPLIKKRVRLVYEADITVQAENDRQAEQVIRDGLGLHVGPRLDHIEEREHMLTFPQVSPVEGEIKIQEDVVWELLRSDVLRDLLFMGYSLEDAERMVAERSRIATAVVHARIKGTVA